MIFPKFLFRREKKKEEEDQTLEEAIEESLEIITSPDKSLREKIVELLRQARQQAGKSIFFAFLGFFYVLGATGTFSQTDLVNVAIGTSFFISITLVLMLVWWERKSQKKIITTLDKKIGVLENDMVTISRKSSETIDELVKENVRQSNHFEELLQSYENMAYFSSLIYSYERHKILSINNTFKETFGITKEELNSIIETQDKEQSLEKLVQFFVQNGDKTIDTSSYLLDLFHAPQDNQQVEVYLKRILRNGQKTFAPFKISINRLKFAPDSCFQIIFIDITLEKSREEILQMHYLTIVEYTKQLLRGKISNELAIKLLKGMHEYQKNRIKINLRSNQNGK